MNFGDIGGDSPALRLVLRQVETVAPSLASIFFRSNFSGGGGGIKP